MMEFFLSLTCLLPLMNHPLSFGLLILLVSTFSSFLLAKYFFYWFGYSLFLVFVGGLLVMFSYVAALTPNLKNTNLKYFVILFFVFLFFIYFLLGLLDQFYSFNYNSWLTMGSSSQVVCMGGLLESSNITLLIFLLVMLLLTMVMVVKICLYGGGPLRPFSS